MKYIIVTALVILSSNTVAQYQNDFEIDTNPWSFYYSGKTFFEDKKQLKKQFKQDIKIVLKPCFDNGGTKYSCYKEEFEKHEGKLFSQFLQEINKQATSLKEK